MENLPTLPPVDEAALAEHRVVPVEHGGTRLWAKHGAKNYANLFLRMMCRLVNPGKGAQHHVSANLDREITAITALRASGFLVPEIVGQTEQYLLLSDIGPTLHVTLRNLPPEDRLPLIAEAAKTLRRLHDAGHWHGAAALKNMTVLNGQIGYIDFESAMHCYIGKRATQWLDVWQFASTVAYFDTQGVLVAQALAAYGDSAAVRKLKTAAWLLLPLYAALKPFAPHLPRDVRQAVRAIAGIYRV